MKHDFEESLRFLRWLYQDGPWMLTCISPDKKSIEARTFEKTEIDELLAWLSLHQRRNLYYSVNQPIEKARGKRKLAKSDVHTVHFLHVDVDPRTGEPIEAEQARIEKQLLSYRVPFSGIVFSGGGYNAVFRLTDPQLIHDPSDEELSIARATNVERRNWQLEIDFSTPDHCRDVSRILRLPGTINWPNEEKIKKGRMPALARIVQLNDLAYDFSAFAATPVVATNVGSSKTAKVSENIQRIEDPSYLGNKYGLSSKTQVMIAQGHDPDDPKTVKSRSENLFGVVCDMVRANVPDAEILGVITDSKFGISESVLDKGASVMRYATRQLSRAKDKAVHPRLLDMNDEYAVVENYGGRCVVMREERKAGVEQGTAESNLHVTLSFQHPNDFFRARAANKVRWINERGKEVAVNEGKWWFEQPRRRQYSKVVFEPGEDTPGAYNLWRGFTTQPMPGEKHLNFLRHVLENVCSGDEVVYQYLISWIARVFQTPRTQSETAIVLIGSRGAGKSFFANQIRKLFGEHAITVSSIDQLTGHFNAHLADKVLVIAEEAYHMYDRRHESTLKEMITGSRQVIVKKGYDAVERSNYTHLIMISNNDRVVPAGDKERRFLVLKVSESVLQNQEYFSALAKEMKDGGSANLLHHLLTLDLSKFEVRDVPKTAALREQQIQNLSYELEWLLGKLHRGVWVDGHEHWSGPVEKEQLYRDYLTYVVRLNVRHPMPYRVWHEWFCKSLPDVRFKQLSPKTLGDRPWAFVFPPLETCREKFCADRAWADYTWDPITVDEEEERQTTMDSTEAF